jgi:hypothetical protein
MSILLRLSISFCSRHCCTLVLAPSISSCSGSGSSVQKRETETESYSPLPHQSRKSLLLSIALLTTPHSVRLSVLSLPPSFLSTFSFFAASWSSCRCRWRYMRRIVKSCWIGCGRNWKAPAETPPTVSSFCRFFQFFLPLRLQVLPPCLLALPCLSFLSCLLAP